MGEITAGSPAEPRANKIIFGDPGASELNLAMERGKIHARGINPLASWKAGDNNKEAGKDGTVAARRPTAHR